MLSRIRNPLLRLLARNALIGAAVALVAVALVLATDTAHLRSLILQAKDPVIPLILLAFGFLVTMCSAVMGTAIMALGKPETGGRGGKPVRAELSTGEAAAIRLTARR